MANITEGEKTKAGYNGNAMRVSVVSLSLSLLKSEKQKTKTFQLTSLSKL